MEGPGRRLRLSGTAPPAFISDNSSVDDEFPAPHTARLLPGDCPLQAVLFERTAAANRFRLSDVRNFRGEKQAGQESGVTLAGCCAPIRKQAQSEHGFVKVICELHGSPSDLCSHLDVVMMRCQAEQAHRGDDRRLFRRDPR
jgi:hypothetical protein